MVRGTIFGTAGRAGLARRPPEARYGRRCSRTRRLSGEHDLTCACSAMHYLMIPRF